MWAMRQIILSVEYVYNMHARTVMQQRNAGGKKGKRQKERKKKEKENRCRRG
jgi:hypothetical protein